MSNGRTRLGVALTLALGASVSAYATEDPLAGYRWRSRILVIAAPERGDARLETQRTALSAAKTGLSERDLVALEAVGHDIRTDALRRRLGIPVDRFRAVLVGKDGDIKLASDEPIQTDTLFRVIDAMPMRRDEIRQHE